MKLEKMKSYVNENLNEDDVLIGYFWSMEAIKIWLFMLIGPFAAFSMKFYVVAVSEKGLYFHRINFLEKFADTDFFTYEEIETLALSKGMLNALLKFHFVNGRKLKLKSPLKGKNAIISTEIQTFLLEKLPRPE